MIKIFKPNLNQLILSPNHVLVWIKSGNGLIEVDFKTYTDYEDKVIFLAPNQPLKFVFGDFEVALLEFPNQLVSKSRDYRVLFKHLISLGYIAFSEKKQEVLETLFAENPLKILDISTNQWYYQNPFQANKEEYSIIFDLKEVIDLHFNENYSVDQLVKLIKQEHYSIHTVVKNKLGLTIKNLAQKKLLIESQKDIAFTDKPIKAVAYDMGFNDPAYFNRFFKEQINLTPSEFRANFGNTIQTSDTFVQDLLFLIQQHHPSERSTTFYADTLHMSIKTLSRKVKDRLNLTVGDLIRVEIINTAKKLLQDLPIKEVAYELGFEEPNHFSSFFKKHTGITPTEYQFEFLSKKYNS
jgi:AraC-like DNA-binding protein